MRSSPLNTFFPFSDLPFPIEALSWEPPGVSWAQKRGRKWVGGSVQSDSCSRGSPEATLQTLCLCGPLGPSWKRLYKPYAYVDLLGPPGSDFTNPMLMWASWKRLYKPYAYVGLLEATLQTLCYAMLWASESPTYVRQ